ncbi:MAG: GTPase HflX [Ignavibacteria bacterium RIFOXYB2_FULL_35_12]|nr:MAG: GTPase HflX [Ignavibacteria bacterium GWA2_36_19]OGU54947.1 MAG: GTPase HflX [Ignavibacteria bacterium GWC2_35_8]OGU58554.1 MAG: GTPase HflX [Ignavibacteria bacterium GWF2_35_20]OGU82906.1 MAG: GTPase HflX [Ignavibacteria bacterium RIFOXYA2_FULL_35_9]OGU90118.1 MAG: GTPase HflX [Ignavibacteria bacterium RIFOXYA12_FULL_35_25]OGU92107.1 MAG: GTPase HflX [Ignavibacteria bacterium RIFOXYC12_FULL_35_11]OGU95908.1 MAG: GTPase HflX [Ignavibacteria bacterium RIFOXYB12_FULL_35_14]OGU99322.1 M
MIEIQKKNIERTILVALNTKEIKREIVEEHLDELEELARTAGAETIIKIIQDKYSADPAFYIGKGKAEELSSLVEINNIDLVIFDDDLSAVQVRNLERLINRKIVDRSGLILDIFASRAKTKEAKTQVELAQLQYLLPRLTRAWTHLSKQYGGIGTKGPGETQIETDRRIIRNRISHLKEKLQKIESEREIQSRGRADLIRISLVGYTNAGKSTLFNLLTKSDVFAEDKLFATLDSTTRIYNLNKQKLLLSDTVGFIRKLPHHLVASFKSTLNEVRSADVILHIIDFAHPYFADHIDVVEETLAELGCKDKAALKVFNKVDIVKDKSKIDFVKNRYENSVIISAERGINISSLEKKLLEMIEHCFVHDTIEIDIQNSKLASKIHSIAKVLSTKYFDSIMKITYKANKENAEKIRNIVQSQK